MVRSGLIWSGVVGFRHLTRPWVAQGFRAHGGLQVNHPAPVIEERAGLLAARTAAANREARAALNQAPLLGRDVDLLED